MSGFEKISDALTRTLSWQTCRTVGHHLARRARVGHPATRRAQRKTNPIEANGTKPKNVRPERRTRFRRVTACSRAAKRTQCESPDGRPHRSRDERLDAQHRIARVALGAVEAGAAVDRLADSVARVQPVVAIAADEEVGPGFTEQRVVARFAAEVVVAGAGFQTIVAAAAVQGVVAPEAAEQV